MKQRIIANNGELIRRLIREKGFTQQGLADFLGYTLGAVQKWCRVGVNDYHVLAPLSHALDIAVTDLIYLR